LIPLIDHDFLPPLSLKAVDFFISCCYNEEKKRKPKVLEFLKIALGMARQVFQSRLLHTNLYLENPKTKLG